MRKGNRRIAVLIVAMALAALVALPGSAFAATKTVYITGGKANLSASLNGPNIGITGRAYDTSADGRNIYLKATVIRSYATDPSKEIARTTGGSGTSKYGSWYWTSYYGFPQYVKMTVCRERNNWFDSCESANVSFN